MAHCTCAARALELFVKQVAGLNTKRTCQSPAITRNRKRLGIQPFTRSLQTTSAKRTDDAHIPFESTAGQDSRATHHVNETEPAEPCISDQEPDDWHAEVIVRPSVHATATSPETLVRSMLESTPGAEPPTEDHSGSTVDAVYLRNLFPPTSIAHFNKGLIPITTDVRPATMQKLPTISRRAESRKLRKSRRQEEGKYRQRAQEVQQQKPSDDGATLASGAQMSHLSKPPKVDHADAPEVEIVETLVDNGPGTSMLEAGKGLDGPKITIEEGKKIESDSLEAVENNQVTSVLDLIEGLVGPDVKLEKPKKIDPKTYKAEKKRKYDKMVAEKALAKANERALAAKRQKEKEPWQVQKAALKSKFGDVGWSPRKRLSPDTLEGIRAIHASDPTTYTTETLSEHFKVTPEAVRRILKSRWQPSEDEAADRRARWERRGVKKWEALAGMGVKPPAKWRAMGVGSEKGTMSERVPKRNLNRRGDGSNELSWDEVVADMGDTEGVAARIL